MKIHKRRDTAPKKHKIAICSFLEESVVTTYKTSRIKPVLFVTTAIDYINFLVQQKSKQEEDLDNLRKEVMALKIMKS